MITENKQLQEHYGKFISKTRASLDDIRIMNGLTETELADRSGLNKNTISSILNCGQKHEPQNPVSGVLCNEC